MPKRQPQIVDPSDAARQLLQAVWSDDNDEPLCRLRRCRVTTSDELFDGTHGARWLRHLVHAYKSFVPDLRFVVERERQSRGLALVSWRAEGHHDGAAAGVPPTGRVVRLRGVLRVSCASEGHVAHIHGGWDIATLLARVGITADAFASLLVLPRDMVRLRAMYRHGNDVPVLFFPTLNLPGWVTWKRFIDAIADTRNVATFESIATRLAFEGARRSRRYAVRDDTRGVCRALELAGLTGPFDVVGHSAGGTLALDFALQAGSHVRSLVLVEPSVAWVLEGIGAMDAELRQFVSERLEASSRRMTPSRYAAFLRAAYMEKDYEPTASPKWPMLCAYMRNMQYRSALYVHTDDPDRLASISCPVLLICGRDTDRFHRDSLSALARLLTDSRLTEMPGGHVPHFGAGFLPFLRLVEQFHASIGVTSDRHACV